jgi:LCP family protein required for cell wall assembly
MRAFLGRFAIALLVVVVMTSAAIAEAYHIAANKVKQVATVKINPAFLQSGNNFLFIGSDTRTVMHTKAEASQFGTIADVGSGQRSDTIMVAHINPHTGQGTIVSFPRDLWVSIPGIGNAKINAAFNKGPERVIETIEHDFNIPISHYLEINFLGFRNLVNTLGTIPIYFATPARDLKTGLMVKTAGCQHLNGDQALAYVRSRYYERLINGQWQTDPTSDLGRIQRQQYFLRTLATQAVRKAEHSPWHALSILDKMLASLERDQKMGLNSLRAVAYAFSGNAGPLVQMTLPTNRQFEQGQDALVLDDAKASPILARLRGEDDNQKSSSTTSHVAPSSVKVTVLNGSGRAGEAATALTALKNLGFIAASPATNADRSDYSVTEVRYAPGAQNKAQLVLARLGGAGKLVALPSAVGNADVVVVLGTDFSAVRAPSSQASGSGAPTTKQVVAPPPKIGCS